MLTHLFIAVLKIAKLSNTPLSAKLDLLLTYLKSLHEGLGARFGDGSKVIDEVSFGHADSSINKG